MYAELEVVERVEEFSCAAADVSDVGRATSHLICATTHDVLSVHSS